MPTHRLIAALAVCSAAFVFTGTALADTPNPLVNPGFEQGLTGWHPTNGTLTLAAPHSGTNSARISVTQPGPNMTIQPSVIPLTSTRLDELYSAGAWVYAPRAGEKLCVVITERDQNGVFQQQTASCRVSTANTWEHVHGQWASRTSGHSLSIGVQEWYPRAGDWFDADDVTLVGLSLPHNVAPPTISGAALIGSTLTVDPGTWQSTTAFVYHWQLCFLGECDTVYTSSQSTWTIPDTYFGRSIRVVVEGQNSAGSTQVASAQTAIVPEPPS